MASWKFSVRLMATENPFGKRCNSHAGCTRRWWFPRASTDWEPAFDALESYFTCRLGNAAHIKQVPLALDDVKTRPRDPGTCGRNARVVIAEAFSNSSVRHNHHAHSSRPSRWSSVSVRRPLMPRQARSMPRDGEG